ncbi:MAG: FAD-dependent oxidoreductase [Nanoarchaeota archaeon]|nr:FAD-dependent oxidoreductase [Nanoarchaeota archaeon]
MYDMLIIGGGPAGLSAAIYANRYKMKNIVITRERYGLLAMTHLVENWPGEIKISGMDLMKKLEKHALALGSEIVDDEVVRINKQDDGNFKVITKSGKEYEAKTVLIAIGMERRKLNVPGEKEYLNRGVSYCATCDGALFTGRVVAVIGGSDSAAKEALLLTQYAKKVYIIYRGEQIHPEPLNMEAVMKKVEEGKIEIINNANVKEIKGNGSVVTGVVLDREYNGSNELPLDGVFVEIGSVPNDAILKPLGVELDAKGHIKINRRAETNIPGVYAAGDIVDDPFPKQAITGAAEGAIAVMCAFEYLHKR